MLNSNMVPSLLRNTRHLLYLFWTALFNKKVKPGKTIEIDVIIPAIESDLETLPLCIEGLRKNVCHPIKNIYLVSPNKKSITDFAAAHEVIFVNEDSLLGYSPSDIDYKVTGGRYIALNRAGWIFQQLVKLSGKVGTCRYYLTIDADHILMKPHVFVTEENELVFYQSREYNMPYYVNIKKMLGRYPVSVFSYVSHKMIFDKEELKGLYKKIEAFDGGGQSWDKVILSSLDSNVISGFSEFELFGNYVAGNKKVLLPWREKMLPKNEICGFAELQKSYPAYWSLTFPAYFNKKK